MNQSDRAMLAEFAKQIETLSSGLKGLEQLGKKETVAALEDLVRIAPTLKKLAEGYDAAGTVGGWFGRFLKFIASLTGVILAIAAIWALYFGDSK